MLLPTSIFFQVAYAPTAVNAFLKILAMDMILLESQDLQTQRTVYSMVVSLAQIFQVWKFLHYIIDSFYYLLIRVLIINQTEINFIL